MEWLNYHHLLYFWTAARVGGITKASAELNLTQPTLSGQIRTLERRLGHPLFARQGRRLVLTEVGQVAYRYAEEIFGLGRELLDTVKGRPTGRPMRLRVGVVDAVPKLVAYRLLRPALEMPGGVRLICTEGKAGDLLAELSLHHLDVVVSDAPVGEGTAIKAFGHLLGETGIAFFAVKALARKLRRGFPRSLSGAPFLAPAEGTSLRAALRAWCEQRGIALDVVAEFADSALLKAFGQTGLGVFPAPIAIAGDVERQYAVEIVGRAPEVKERFYAISVERRVRHPAVLAISRAAPETLA